MIIKKTPLICVEWVSETNDITFDCLDNLQTLGYNEFLYNMKMNIHLHYQNTMHYMKFKTSLPRQ
jgi:hypothetical protein